MGRKRNKNRITRGYTPPANAKVVPYDDKMMAKMQAATAPQKEQASAFSPGSPIPPIAGITLPSGPRTWQFPIGYNIGQLPRSTEENSFDTLRGLASLYDGIQLAEQVWFDLCSRLEIDIVPTDEALKQAGGDASVYASDIAGYKAFFEMPDRDEGLDFSNWIVKALRDQLELDAVAIYVQLDRIGRPHSLQLIDGATVKPLIDARGRKPVPPYPAYQQFWQGLPLGLYTSDQILYHRETQRTDSMYGLSRVERVIMRVNQALRKQNRDLSRFTEGNLPPGILEMPPTDDDWTPDEILTFQRIWDGLLGGNDKSRVRLKVVPNGSKYQAIQDVDVMTPFDSFLLNTTAACFGLTMADFGFTENVNKSSGESQENVTYRRAMSPLTGKYGRLFTFILWKYFGDRRFKVHLKGYEEAEDLNMQATAYSTLVKVGIVSPTTAAQLMHLPIPDDEKNIPPYYGAATGPVFFEDMLDPEIRAAHKQQAIQQALQAVQTTQAGNKQQEQGNENDEENTQGTPKANSSQKQGNTQDAQSKATSTNRHVEANANDDTRIEQIGQSSEVSEEYRRWRTRAIDDVKAAKPFRPFTTSLIPENAQKRIVEGLATCTSADDVRRIFELERASASNNDVGAWQLTDPEIAQRISGLQKNGVKRHMWKSGPNCCESCLQNDGQVVEVGKPFKSGALTTPNHNHCECGTEEVK